MFDSISFDPSSNAPLSHPYEALLTAASNSPSFGKINIPGPPRNPSPTASLLNGSGMSHLDAPHSYEQLLATNTTLKTRVSELEVINDLFRGRVAELEASEGEARRAQDESVRREETIRRHIEELKYALHTTGGYADADGDDEAAQGGRRTKRMRMSDLVDDGRAGTPLSASGVSLRSSAS